MLFIFIVFTIVLAKCSEYTLEFSNPLFLLSSSQNSSSLANLLQNLQTVDENIIIELKDDIIIGEKILITTNFSIKSSNEGKKSISFGEQGELIVQSENLCFSLISCVLKQKQNILNKYGILIQNTLVFFVKDCVLIFEKIELQSSFWLIENSLLIIFESNDFSVNLTQTATNKYSGFLEFNNISNVTFNNCSLNNSYFVNTFFMRSYASYVYLKTFSIYNNIQITNFYLGLFEISFFIEINDFTIINNTFEGYLIKNIDYLEVFNISSAMFKENRLSTILIDLNNGKNIYINDINIESHQTPKSLLQISLFLFIKVIKLVLLENVSESSILIQNCNDLSLDAFLCAGNNKNYLTSSIEIGSCLKILNIPNIEIFQSKISDSVGLMNIPGIIISNNFISSKIIISNCIFLNNMYNSSLKVLTFGCALHISSYPTIELKNNYFHLNYALLANVDFGGPMLYFTSNRNSDLSIQNCIIEDNFSYKKSLAIEFRGYNLTIKNCLFQRNLQHAYSFSSFSTQMIINGIANYVEISNSAIINNKATDGLFFLYERRELTMIFDYVNVLNNTGSLCAGFNSQFETKKRSIILSNFIFANNSISGGATFIYMYIYSTIVKFNFTVINSSLEDNYANPRSYGFIVVWVYCNNMTFILYNTTIKRNNFSSLIPERAFISFFGIRELLYSAFIETSFIGNIAGNIFLYCFFSKTILRDCIVSKNNFIGTQQLFLGKLSYITLNNTNFIDNLINDQLFGFFGNNHVAMNNIFFKNNSIERSFLESSQNPSIEINNSIIKDNLLNKKFECLKSYYTENFIMNNNSFTNNYGNFPIFFKATNSKVLFIHIMIENNSDEDKILFYTNYGNLECIGLIINWSQTKGTNALIYGVNSVFNLSSNSYNLSLGSHIFNQIILLKCDFVMENTQIFNISFDSSQYFIYSYQSKVALNSIIFEHCQNIMKLEYSYLNIIDSTFYNISSSYSELIIFDFQKNIEIYLKNDKFIQFRSNISSFSLTNQNNYTLIERCIFEDHGSDRSLGGVFYIENSKITIIFSTFNLNIGLRGGVFYFSCDFKNKDSCSYNLTSNAFTNNKATIDGGVYKFKYVEPININSTYNNNTAYYGPIYSSYYSKLGFEIINNNNQIFSSFTNNQSDIFFFENLPSNTLIQDYQIKFWPLDTFNQVIQEKLDTKIYIDLINYDEIETYDILKNYTRTNSFYCSSSSPINYVGKVSLMQIDNESSFTFDDFRITTCPTDLVYLRFYSNEIPQETPFSVYAKKNSLNEKLTNDGYSIIIPTKIGSCQQGQFYNPNIYTCMNCSEGYYSLVNDTFSCKPCLDHAICPGSGFFEVEQNYWNHENFLENIYSCNLFAENCAGGVESTCSDGFQGITCENCIRIIKNKIYYKDYLGNCNECPNLYLILFSYVLLLAVFIYIMRFILRILTNKSSNDTQDQKFAIKIIINFIHLIVYTRNQFEGMKYVSYDNRSLLKNIKFFLKIEYIYISFDCVYFNYDHNVKENPFLEIIVHTLLIYILMLIYYIILRYKALATNDILNRFSIIIYTIFPILFASYIESLSFRKVNGDILLKNQTSFQLDDVKFYLIFFIVPNLLFYITILIYFNVYLPQIGCDKTGTIIEMQTTGLKNVAIYESLNIASMIFFFLLNIIEMDNDIKNQTIFFAFFYRFILELKYCSFKKPVYSRINYFYKLIFVFDFLIIVFLASDVFIEISLPFLFIEVVLLFSFLFSLLVFYKHWKISSKALLFQRTITQRNYIKKASVVPKKPEKAQKTRDLSNNIIKLKVKNNKK